MKRHAALTSTYANVLGRYGTLQARASKKAHPEPLKRLARGVAVAIGIALSMQTTAIGQGSIMPYKDLHSLADYQLTDKQLHCHNQITFKESSNRIDAVNKYNTAFGYYQLKNKAVKGAPYDVQFYYFWAYVSHRYGVTRYDEPNYCAALAHLQRKGWQ